MTQPRSRPLHFDVSSGLKSVLGSELITNDQVAIFELVKNSFDADAKRVHIYFGGQSIIVADNGKGMSYQASVARMNEVISGFFRVPVIRAHFAELVGNPIP
jgi:hypothetical protein